MNASRTCPQCGAELSQDSPEGLCPKCLLAAAVESEVALPSAPNKTMVLSFETLAAAPVGTKLSYFGDYELLQEIARGGMGVVYKARQVSLNRIVAVKMILSGQLASETEVKRFHTEAEAAANLQHPNIVAIHEVGEHEGRHYFSMDYVEGKNLSELIKDEPLPPTKAAQYVKTMAEAIQYAHQRGILHRDLKPQNVLIDEFDQPRITDFGLARQLKRDSSVTQEGAVMGSPSYMPPEQAAGRQDLVGPHSDVYSLGAILYQVLTGRAPFEGETPMATLRKVAEEEPVSPKKHCPLVPADLETICLKCLEKSPQRRYATARELVEELGRFLNHEPILAKPNSAARRFWSWGQRHRWEFAGVFSIMLLALICLCYGLWAQNRFLVWKWNHPAGNAKEYVPWTKSLPESFHWFPIIAVLCGLIGLERVPKNFRTRKLAGQPVPAAAIFAYGALGVLCVLVGTGMMAFWVDDWLFRLAELPAMGIFWTFLILALGCSIVWASIREYQHALFGLDEKTARKLVLQEWREEQESSGNYFSGGSWKLVLVSLPELVLFMILCSRVSSWENGWQFLPASLVSWVASCCGVMVFGVVWTKFELNALRAVTVLLVMGMVVFGYFYPVSATLIGFTFGLLGGSVFAVVRMFDAADFPSDHRPWYQRLAAHFRNVRCNPVQQSGSQAGVKPTREQSAAIRAQIKAQAEQGDRDSQFQMALIYLNGDGVSQDYQEVLKWSHKAAAQGSDLAWYVIGRLHAEGKGVPKSDGEAAKWFCKAAEVGMPWAQLELARAHVGGIGVEKDLVEACKWFLIAAKHDHPKRAPEDRVFAEYVPIGCSATWDPALAFRTTRELMTPEQFAEASRAAELFVPKKTA